MANDEAWLYRDGDLILGPVASQKIIDKLYAGELRPQSEVQLMGTGTFQRLADVPDFKVHVAKSEAKRRVDTQAQEHQAAQKRKQRRSLMVGLGVLVTLGVLVAALGNYLAVHPLSFGDSDQEVEVSAPTISKAKRRVDDEMVDYQGAKRPSNGSTAVAARQPTGTKNSGTKMGSGGADPDGMQMGEIDEAGINGVVAKNKASLIPCIKSVATPGVFLKIPIEFSIAEAGKVSKVWVDNPDLKNSGLQECLLKELQKWPFKPAHSGNSVNLSFNVGKKG